MKLTFMLALFALLLLSSCSSQADLPKYIAGDSALDLPTHLQSDAMKEALEQQTDSKNK